MTVKNSNTTHPNGNPLAEDSARSVTVPSRSTDELLEALGDKMGMRFRELIDAMTDSQKREFERTALKLMAMDSGQLARIAKYVASERTKGGAE